MKHAGRGNWRSPEHSLVVELMCDGLFGMTAFHCACEGGHMEIVVYLSQDVKCRIGKCVSVA